MLLVAVTDEEEKSMFHFYYYYSLVLFVLQYLLPVMLMTYCYLMVASTIWKRKSTIAFRGSKSSANSSKEGAGEAPTCSREKRWSTRNMSNCKDAREVNMMNGRRKVHNKHIVPFQQCNIGMYFYF